jgi:hypothetical protein
MTCYAYVVFSSKNLILNYRLSPFNTSFMITFIKRRTILTFYWEKKPKSSLADMYVDILETVGYKLHKRTIKILLSWSNCGMAKKK